MGFSFFGKPESAPTPAETTPNDGDDAYEGTLADEIRRRGEVVAQLQEAGDMDKTREAAKALNLFVMREKFRNHGKELIDLLTQSGALDEKGHITEDAEGLKMLQEYENDPSHRSFFHESDSGGEAEDISPSPIEEKKYPMLDPEWIIRSIKSQLTTDQLVALENLPPDTRQQYVNNLVKKFLDNYYEELEASESKGEVA